MTCELAVYRRVVIVQWGTPEERDLGAVENAVDRANTADGAPPVVISIVPESAPAPSDGVRQEMARRVSTLLSKCTAFHHVMEGGGFGAAVKRTATAAMHLMAGKHVKMLIHSSLVEVPDATPKEVRSSVVHALSLFGDRFRAGQVGVKGARRSAG